MVLLRPFGGLNMNVYRFGFNGMEKVDEVSGEGNDYDFGARMYSPRIGRWFSQDKIFDPKVTNYAFVCNSPILYKDINGKIQRDPNGNIIFTPLTQVLHGEDYHREVITDNVHFVDAILIEGFIYADDGTPIFVRKVVKQVDFYYEIDEEGGQSRVNYLAEPSEDYTTNCYGKSLTGGQFIIPGIEGYDQNTLLASDYTKVEASEKNVEKGDILTLNGGAHMIVAVGKNKKGEVIWTSKNGFGEAYTGTLTDLKKQHGSIEGEEWIDFDLSKSSLYKKKNQDLRRTDGQPYINEESMKKVKKDYKSFKAVQSKVGK